MKSTFANAESASREIGLSCFEAADDVSGASLSRGQVIVNADATNATSPLFERLELVIY